MQISLVFPLEGCCSNFAPEKAYVQQASNKTFEGSKPCLKPVLIRISEACQNFGVLVKKSRCNETIFERQAIKYILQDKLFQEFLEVS